MEDRSVVIRDFGLDECPVSFLTNVQAGLPKEEFVTGPRALQLVKIWARADRQKQTISEQLGLNESWVDDAEEIILDLHAQVKSALEQDVEKRIKNVAGI